MMDGKGSTDKLAEDIVNSLSESHQTASVVKPVWPTAPVSLPVIKFSYSRFTYAWYMKRRRPAFGQLPRPRPNKIKRIGQIQYRLTKV